MIKLKRKLQFRGHVYFQAVRPHLILHALQWLQSNNPLYQNITVNLENIDPKLSSAFTDEQQTPLNSTDSSEIETLSDLTCDTNNNRCETHCTLNKDVPNNTNCSNSTTFTTDHSSGNDDDNDDDDDDDDDDDNNDCEKEDPLNQHRAATCETCIQSIIPDYPVILDDETTTTSTGNEIFNIAPGENKHPVSMMTDRFCEELAFPVLFPKGQYGYKMDRKEKLTPVKYFNAWLLHYTGRFAMNPEYLFFAQFIIEQKKVSDSINIALKKLHGQPVTALQLKSNQQYVKNLIFKDQAYLFLRNIPGSPPYWQKFMFEVLSMVQQLGIPTWFLTLSCADLRWPELFHILSRIKGQNMTDEQIDNLSYNEKCSLLNLNPVITAKHFQYRVESFFKDVLLSNANPIGKIVYYALRIEFQMRGSPHLYSLIWTSDCPELNNENEQAYITYIDKHVQATLPDKANNSELHDLLITYQKHTHSRSCKKYKNIPCRFNFGQFFTDQTVVSKPLPDNIHHDEKELLLNKRNDILSAVKQKINENLDSSKPNYNPNITEDDLLAAFKISKREYNWALSVSSDSDFDLHLKRSIHSCFINNYFEAGIRGFRANVDLQPVFNHYKCITYVCSYFSKDETECSQAIKCAAKEAKTNNDNVKDTLNKVATAFLSCREELCLAQFAAYYRKDYRTNPDEVNDVQPNILTDDLLETNHNFNSQSTLPQTIKLINSQETMKCRKVKAVIRYHTPNRTKEPEKFYHHLLMLYFPWRKESDLLGTDQLYSTKYQDPVVNTKVEANRKIFEPNAKAIDIAFHMFSENSVKNLHSYDPINDQENDDLLTETTNDTDEFNQLSDHSPEELLSLLQTSQTSTPISTYHQPSAMTDDDLRNSVRSLNAKQRFTYDVVLSWCRNTVKNVNCLNKQTIKPIHIFVTGGGGGGKSHLITTIYHTSLKTFKYTAVNPSLPTVLLMASTGVAAINISGTTINTALAIPKDTGIHLSPLSDQKKTLLRLTLSELKLLIIDEISMVSNNMLLHIHQRLKEIFGTLTSNMFAGISIIAVGDLLQLPPIKQKPIFCPYTNDIYNLSHPWHEFKMVELDEIMRQKDDQPFIELLNRFRLAKHTQADICTIQSRAVDLNDKNSYPANELHVWAENNPATQYNNQRLKEILMPLHLLQAIDQYPENVSIHQIQQVLSKGRSYTAGLDFEISIKQGARVMLTNNIDISDRLINGQLGTVARILLSEITQKPTIVYIKFDDEHAGTLLTSKSTDIFAIEHKLVPIKPILGKIKLNPGKRSSPEIHRLQFPLTLAWACTVHKVQGLTLNKIVVSFELFKQKTFNYGQIYVALSRATSLNGLYILGKLEHKHVKADPRVHNEYERLRNTSLLHDDTNFQVQEDDPIIPIVLLNIRSLRKHSIDVKFHTKMLNSDLLLFTETQLTPSDLAHDIQDYLYPFMLNRQDSQDKYLSLAFCNKPTVIITHKQYLPAINGLILTLIFTTRNNYQITLLLLYRKQTHNLHDFINNLTHITTSFMIDLIYLNYLDENQSHT
ncbi:hypothetical protein ACROYT_G015152 [Oculina patagonica]